MKQYHPTLLLYEVPSDDPTDLATAIENNKCVGAVMTRADFNWIQNNKKGNPSCNLVIVGDSLRDTSGGWYVQ